MSSPAETDPPRPPPPDPGGETQTTFRETEVQSRAQETETQSAAQEGETQLRGLEQDSASPGPHVPVTPVNGQITDALNQAMAALLAGAPALLAQALEQVTAQSVGLAMLNAVQAQQSAALIATAAATRAAARIASPRGAGVPPHV